MSEVEALVSSEGALEILKILILVGLLLYMAFSLLVIRQTKLMTRTVTGTLDRPIKVISWLHFFLTASIFLAAFLFL